MKARQELNELQRAIESLREKIIGFMVTPSGIELAVDNITSINVTGSLGVSTTHWNDESPITLHKFPDGKSMNQMLAQPFEYADWYNKNMLKK